MMQAAALRATTRSPRSAPARSVTELYNDFEAAHAVFFRLDREYDAAPADNFGPAWHKRFEAATHRCSRIGRQLLRTPATSLAEIILKLRTTAWMHCDADYDKLEDLDHRMPQEIEETEAASVLASVQADLVRLTEAH
jgi:hypothetical protein